MYRLGKNSLKKLDGVDPRLQAVVLRAIELSAQDFTVVEGLRTLERQKILFAQGRTQPGKIVTETMKSKHLEGLAVDIAPWENGAIDWNTTARFDVIAKAMFQAAKELGIGLRWGADWDRDGRPRERGESDSPHFELT